MRALVCKWRNFDDDGLVSHSFIVLTLSLAGGLASALFHVVMGRTLSISEYGILAAMLNTVLTVWMPMMSLQNTLAHFTEHLRQKERLGDVRHLVSRWSLRLLLIALAVFLIVMARRNTISGFFNIQNGWMVVAATACVLPSLLLPVFVGVLQGAQRFVWMCAAAQAWSVIRMVVAAILAATVVPLAVHGVLSHYLGLVASLATGAVGVMFLLHGRAMGEQDKTETGCDRYFFLSFTCLLSFSVLMYADMALVKHFFKDPGSYGNYARASTIARTIVFLVLPVTSAMFPKVVSRDGGTVAQRKTFGKALALCGVITAGAVLMCWLLAGLMLSMLFGVAVPDAELVRLIRLLALAMCPLGLSFALMNFEMAQNRFVCALPVAVCAISYVGGVFAFHGSLLQVIAVLAAASSCSLAFLVLITFFRRQD